MLGKDYRVLEQIGFGGMAVVYLVEHQTLLKQFAAKVLSSQHASSLEARARFTQEAHAASQLDHENIVRISDFGTTVDDRPFFVMELLRGKTLADRIADGPMTLQEAVAVSVPVARALAHAHAEGIIHRDIKPENIFLVQRSQGRWGVKVLDFGIAKVPVNDKLTKTGEALGSPMFMSPEACRGDEVDQRADVYSFGIVLYLMLAGRVPFNDENLLKVLQMQVVAPLPLPSSFNPDLPAELEMVIIRALAKDPEDRYASMEEFLFALEAALPEGSDELLIQAQFGTSSTPFPGSLDRVRASGRYPGVSASGRFPGVESGPSTGEIAAVRGSTNPGMRATSLPAAPKRRGRGALIAATLLVLAGAGAGGYLYLQHTADSEAAATNARKQPAASPPPAAPAIAQTVDRAAVPAPHAPEPAAAAPVNEPAAPPVEVAAAAPDAHADEAEPAAPEAGPSRGAAKAPKTTRPAIVRTKGRITTTAPKVTETRAGHGSETSGSAAIVATTPAPVAPAVEAPKPVEAAPPPAAPVPAPPSAPVAKAPAPAPAPRPAAVPVGSMDAMPAIANLDVNGPLPASVVRRGVERVLPSLRACYRAAASAQKKTPVVALTLTFEIDENSSATNVAGGAASFGSLSSCVRNAVGEIQTQQAPDVGTAQVGVTIKFTPL